MQGFPFSDAQLVIQMPEETGYRQCIKGWSKPFVRFMFKYSKFNILCVKSRINLNKLDCHVSITFITFLNFFYGREKWEREGERVKEKRN